MDKQTFGFGPGKHGLYEAEVDCDDVQGHLSNFSIVLDGKHFEIKPESYLLDCKDLPPGTCQNEAYCLFGIDSMDTEMGAFNQ